MNITEYLKFRKPYERTLRQLILELEFFIEEVKGVNVYSVQSRLKTYESALEKSRKITNLNISDMQDIAGIRIVVATFEEINVIARFLSRKADSSDLVIELDKPIQKNNGYRARHIVVKFNGHYSRSLHPTRIEIQLQTILQHAYNFISRAWVYKSEHTFSNNWEQNFREVSLKLAQLDTKISELQEQVLATSASEGNNDPLTPFSYQRIVENILSENVDLNEAVDNARMLSDMGCDTNGKLKLFLSNPDILQLRSRFLNVKSKQMQGFCVLVSNMPLHDFWLMFGTRLEGFNEMLDKLESSFEPQELKAEETDVSSSPS